MDYEERMELLANIKETLMSDRKFYVNRKDWPKVAVFRQKLRDCDEQIARLLMKRATMRAA